MKILIAPDSYKNSLTAMEVCQIIKKGFASAIPHAKFLLCPMADGGEWNKNKLSDKTIK